MGRQLHKCSLRLALANQLLLVFGRGSMGKTTKYNQMKPNTENPPEKIDQFADLKAKLTKLLFQANVKARTKTGERTKDASILEFGFLQGYFFANPDKEPHPYLLLTMASGRSILDP